jgi:hypothetical protein
MRQLFLRAGFRPPIADRITQDVAQLQREYRDFQPSEYGMNPIRVQVAGTIPVLIGNVSCTIPIAFAFPDQYPQAPPLFWIGLARGSFKPSPYLTPEGQFTPVLFSNVAPQSPLSSYLAVLKRYLSDYPPIDPVSQLYARAASEARSIVDGANRAVTEAHLVEVELAGTKHVLEILRQLEGYFQAEIEGMQRLVANGGIPDLAIPQDLVGRISEEGDEAASSAVIADLTEVLEAGMMTETEFVKKVTELGAQHFQRYVWPRLE